MNLYLFPQDFENCVVHPYGTRAWRLDSLVAAYDAMMKLNQELRRELREPNETQVLRLRAENEKLRESLTQCERLNATLQSDLRARTEEANMLRSENGTLHRAVVQARDILRDGPKD